MNELNKKLRERLNTIIEENGIMLKFVEKKTGIVSPTLSRWRYGYFDLGEDKLIIVQEFCEQYK